MLDIRLFSVAGCARSLVYTLSAQALLGPVQHFPLCGPTVAPSALAFLVNSVE
jgi:hypothetical protein